MWKLYKGTPCIRQNEWDAASRTRQLAANTKSKTKKTLEDATYSMNSYGFRCDEFDLEKEANVFIGCSFTLGVGLAVTDTWAYNVYKQFNLDGPYTNLGQGGKSFDYMVRTLFAYAHIGKIKRVFLLIPNFRRIEIPNQLTSGYSDFFDFVPAFKTGTTARQISQFNLASRLSADDAFILNNTIKNFKMIDTLATALGIKYIWGTAMNTIEDNPIHNILQKDYPEIFANRLSAQYLHFNPDDAAYDLMHPGPMAHKVFVDVHYQQFSDFIKNSK